MSFATNISILLAAQYSHFWASIETTTPTTVVKHQLVQTSPRLHNVYIYIYLHTPYKQTNMQHTSCKQSLNTMTSLMPVRECASVRKYPLSTPELSNNCTARNRTFYRGKECWFVLSALTYCGQTSIFTSRFTAGLFCETFFGCEWLTGAQEEIE